MQKQIPADHSDFLIYVYYMFLYMPIGIYVRYYYHVIRLNAEQDFRLKQLFTNKLDYLKLYSAEQLQKIKKKTIKKVEKTVDKKED